MKFVIPGDTKITPDVGSANASIDVKSNAVRDIYFGQFERANKSQSQMLQKLLNWGPPHAPHFCRNASIHRCWFLGYLRSHMPEENGGAKVATRMGMWT